MTLKEKILLALSFGLIVTVLDSNSESLKDEKEPTKMQQVVHRRKVKTEGKRQIANVKAKKQDLAELKNKVKHFENCLKSENCNYSQEDPRSYHLDLYKEWAQTVIENQNTIVKNWNHGLPWIKIFKESNGYLKKAMLELAFKLKKSEQEALVDTILTDIIAYHDGALIPMALDFLSQNKNSTNQSKIAEAIGEALAHGSPQVSIALAEQLEKVLDKKTLAFYEKAQKEVDQDSSESVILESKITEYKMALSGG